MKHNRDYRAELRQLSLGLHVDHPECREAVLAKMYEVGDEYHVETGHRLNVLESDPTPHSLWLDYLCTSRGLSDIWEPVHALRGIMREPILLDGLSGDYSKAPDVWLAYKTGIHTLVELKHNHHQQQKAREQLRTGHSYLTDIVGVPEENIRMKVAYYGDGMLRHGDYKIHGHEPI